MSDYYLILPPVQDGEPWKIAAHMPQEHHKLYKVVAGATSSGEVEALIERMKEAPQGQRRS